MKENLDLERRIQKKTKNAMRRKSAEKKKRHRMSIYRNCSNFSDEAILKYGGYLKKGFLTGAFHPSYERKCAEDHSNCRNRLSIAHQRTLTIAESKLSDYFCA